MTLCHKLDVNIKELNILPLWYYSRPQLDRHTDCLLHNEALQVHSSESVICSALQVHSSECVTCSALQVHSSECVICSVITLCCWQDVKIQELTS